MFSKFFIERPRFAAVVSLLLVITGILTMFKLPVAEYPENFAAANKGFGNV